MPANQVRERESSIDYATCGTYNIVETNMYEYQTASQVRDSSIDYATCVVGLPIIKTEVIEYQPLGDHAGLPACLHLGYE